MRRVLVLGSLVALAVVAIPGPSASVSRAIESLPEVRQYEPKATPEPRTAPPAPSAAFTLTRDA